MPKNQSGVLLAPSWLAITVLLSFPSLLAAHAHPRPQQQQIVWTDQEKPILDKIRTLRKLSTDERSRTTKELALQIRQLSKGVNKVRLASNLASLSTEGDFGHDTLQEVATTLADALRENPIRLARVLKEGAPPPEHAPGPAPPYIELAELVRYEHVDAKLDDPEYAAAMARLDSDDQKHQTAEFSLTDLHGKTWDLKELRGKVVLVNFWATWCPPCRSEMPDLNALYQQFKDQGFIVLAISDEDVTKVTPYIEQYHYTYPILLDPGRKVHQAYNIEGIPKSFVYDRGGKLVAQSIDMRTRGQFLEMLAQAGLK
jgi:peroxiredoxin